ncbi:hypothetical protein [Streptomyces fuscigenes]|uniref:hypothetical protein n=1 Tax=Streptomyces fuscigenes TaxID=1528880 RepID=UPI001F3A907F|nr:hypothetical protein [Streptomyces fuscigenes]MCF3960317.1 hypothetical protein [Streptomyces fuscigenes]
MTDTTPAPALVVEDQELRPFHDLSSTGLLWLINRQAFHPRGLALSLQLSDEGTATGWSLLKSPDGRPWEFDAATNAAAGQRAEDTLAAAGALPAPEGPHFPAYTGSSVRCVKCSTRGASTTYRPARSARTLLRRDDTLLRGPLPERLERECLTCSYIWDEAASTQTDPAPLTVKPTAPADDENGTDS